MSNLPGALDPGRIGQLSWTELRFRPTQDHVVVKLDPPATTTTGGIIIPKGERCVRGELCEAVVVAAGPGAYDTQGRLIPMQVRAGDRVLVDGDCGWILGPHRVLRQGAVEAVIMDGWQRTAELLDRLESKRDPVDQAERDEYLARHKADLEARAKWLATQQEGTMTREAFEKLVEKQEGEAK